MLSNSICWCLFSLLNTKFFSRKAWCFGIWQHLWDHAKGCNFIRRPRRTPCCTWCSYFRRLSCWRRCRSRRWWRRWSTSVEASSRSCCETLTSTWMNWRKKRPCSSLSLSRAQIEQERYLYRDSNLRLRRRMSESSFQLSMSEARWAATNA